MKKGGVAKWLASWAARQHIIMPPCGNCRNRRIWRLWEGKTSLFFFHTAVRLVFLCDTPDGFCLFSDGEAARKGLLFLNGISSGFLHFPDAFLHQSGVYLMDVFSSAYSGKHQYRQVTAEVFAEGLQTFQHFAGAVFCPAGKQGGGIRAVPGFSARR